MSQKQLSPPVFYATVFLAIGIAWITGTDHLLTAYAGNNKTLLLTISSIKGFVFVAASALLVFYVARCFYQRHQQSQAETKQLSLRFQGLYQTISDGLLEYDITNNICRINDYLQLQLGLPETVTNAMDVFLAGIHPDDQAMVAEKIAQYFDSPGVPWRISFRYRWPDGSYHKVLNRGYTIANTETGTIERCVVQVQDMAASNSFEADLQSRESLVRKEINLKVLKAQEQERKLLAMELHDNIGQLVAASKMYMEHQVQSTNDPICGKTLGILTEAVHAIRDLSASMKPPEFTFENLETAITKLGDKISRIQPLTVSLDCADNFTEGMSQEHQLMVYRIVQEQLNNITKHAGAARVGLTLSRSGHDATIHISDDGVGFDTGAITAGIGLSNMRSRLRLFDGDLKIISRKGAGCTLVARFSVL